MSYAESRSKLANLLIKAGYDKIKSLKAVRYPYVAGIQLKHNRYFWDARHKSIKFYEKATDFIEMPESGYAQINDVEYKVLGDITRVKAFIRVTQETVNAWIEAYGFGAYWYSYPLRVRVKYKHEYPSNEIVESYKSIGSGDFGIAGSGGDYGEKLDFIPLPMVGWLKVELQDPL